MKVLGRHLAVAALVGLWLAHAASAQPVEVAHSELTDTPHGVAGAQPGLPTVSDAASPLSSPEDVPATNSIDEANAADPSPPSLIETGLASWYHPSFSGRRMANGQPYRPTAFTAAHKTLPLDSHARVKNLATGAEVVVRITDRGPHLPNRVVDVSQAAARVLGLIGLGITLVEVHSADEGDWVDFVAQQPAPAPVQNKMPVQNTKRR